MREILYFSSKGNIPKPVHYFLLAALVSFNVEVSDDYLSPSLTSTELQIILGSEKSSLVADLRSPAEFGAAHVPGAVNIPVEELEERLVGIRSDNGVLVYCTNGSRSRQAESILYTNGIDNVYHLEGTFYAWMQDKHPIEKGGVKKRGW